MAWACGAAVELTAQSDSLENAPAGVTADEEAAAAVAEGEVILFEGRIDRMSNELAPPLREGQVLSGFFVVNATGEPEDQDPARDSAQYVDVVVDGEFVFDLNHVMTGFGSWRKAASYLVLTKGDPDAEERATDVYSVTLPVEGAPMGERGWRPQWFQIWLFGERGRFLSSLQPQIPPQHVVSGWFRATYHDAEGEEATVEGTVTFVGPEEGELSPTEKIAQLEAVVADLSARLSAAQAETAAAREHLAAAERRIRGLNATIDLLIQERAALRQELELVQAQRAQADDELMAKIADLEAEHAILTEARDTLAMVNGELERSLAARETDLSAARATIARYEAEQAAPPGTALLKTPVPDSPFPFLPPGHAVRTHDETRTVPVRTESRPLPAEEAASAASEDSDAPSPDSGPPAAAEPVPETASSSPSLSTGRSGPDVEEFEESDESVSDSSGFVRRPRKFRRGR